MGPNFAGQGTCRKELGRPGHFLKSICGGKRMQGNQAVPETKADYWSKNGREEFKEGKITLFVKKTL